MTELKEGEETLQRARRVEWKLQEARRVEWEKLQEARRVEEEKLQEARRVEEERLKEEERLDEVRRQVVRQIEEERRQEARRIEKEEEGRRQEAQRAEQERLQAEYRMDAERILADHSVRVTTFLEVAYRKVVRLDEYGDENSNALYEELYRFLLKLGELEPKLGNPVDSLRRWRRDGPVRLRRTTKEYLTGRSGWIGHIVTIIEERFQSYYAERKATPSVAVDSSMSGSAFEMLVADLLRAAGVEVVSTTQATGDQGADLLFTHKGKRVVVQAKRYQGTVGNAAVQEVFAAKGFFGCDVAWVVTNSRFSRSAIDLASQLGVVLIGDDRMENFRAFVTDQFDRW